VGPGIGAYLLGYLVTYGWLGSRIEPIAGTVWVTRSAGQSELAGLLMSYVEAFGGVSPSTWAGWLFYNAHFVPLSVNAEGRGASLSDPNVLLAADAQLLPVLFLVPPLLLIAAGAVSVAMRSPPTLGGLLPGGARGGMAIIAGYLPLVLVGAVIFAIGEPMGYRGISPNLLWSVLVMGIGYPLLFGGLGGWLATKDMFSGTAPSGNDSEYSPP
jgi:hypothetical protein